MTHSTSTKHLVSCIMPTYNRRRFVPLAIQYFLRQDYTDRELIVIDDGADIIRDLIPDDSRIRYYQLGNKITLGAKLNLACEYARGDIIAHWDDDDWYAVQRLTRQVRDLMADGTDVCGINNLLYYDLRTKKAYQYIYPSDQRLWLLGSSLCYRRELWEGNRFKEIDVGMDGLFVWAVDPERITVNNDAAFSVFMIHDNNVSPKKTESCWWHPFSAEKIRDLLGADWDAYENGNAESAVTAAPQIKVSNDRQGKQLQKPVRNIFACLVHESPECIVDLVRNLRFHDSSSIILLYNGGKNPDLLNHQFLFDRYGEVIHPAPRQMVWGRLHDFALDCMKFSLENFTFDTLTIVDSDQLALRSGYSDYLGRFLSNTSNTGMLGSYYESRRNTTGTAAAVQVMREIDLWRPFLKRFAQDERNFVRWTFWPATVFTADAARELTRVFSTDRQLSHIVRNTGVWATEEVIIPTLVGLLGYEIAASPCNDEYVRYRESYSLQQVEAAVHKPDVFWIHPVGRRYDDRLRSHIRATFNHYEKTYSPGKCEISEKDGKADSQMLLSVPILSAMKKIEGWLAEDEADLLMASCRAALTHSGQGGSVVEIGSYYGKSTVVLGSVAKAVSPESVVYAIDPHNGKVGALDNGIVNEKPTLEKFRYNIAAAGLGKTVKIIRKRSFDVSWDKPINLLFIDGLHDYVNVARDFFHFEPWVVNGGYVLFHDYADYYPGVKAFVHEILGSGMFRKLLCVNSMIALQKVPGVEIPPVM